ncbi:MAG: electron transfer flavoprotein subunit alpha/FixB family protein [Thermoanaerobaculia bacterium]
MSTTVWIVLQQRKGELHRMSWEAIAAGQKLARLLGGDAEAVLLGSDLQSTAQEVARCALAAVRVLDHEVVAEYTPGAFVGALASALRQARPGLVLFPHTYQSVDFVPRLAQTVDAALVPEATAFEHGDEGLVWQRPVLGGRLQARVRARNRATALVTLQSGAFASDEVEWGDGAAPLEELAVDLTGVERDRELLGVEKASSQEVDLSESEIVVSVGRGIGGAENMGIIEELAKELGAEIGASRPVIDSGWLPRERQIGSSGQTVAPKLYLAAGISGAIQHLVGMKGSRVIVAINKDPGAPIFNVAHYGIVGDLHEVVPALTEALREAKAG